MNTRFASGILALAATLAMQVSHAQATPPDNTDSNAANMESNAAERSSGTMTADAQKNDSVDLDLTQRIRKNVMADKTLSTDAHNVKIIAVDGKVTLNGVVRTDREKHRVVMLAEKVAGKDHVVNELTVAPPKS